MRFRHSLGFTLLEILLVMVLLSVMAMAVVPNLPQKENDEAKNEAYRFFQLIQLWTEKSLLTGQTLGLRVEKDSYQLLHLSRNEWVKVEQDKNATSVTIPESLEMVLEVTGFMEEEDQLFNRDSFFDEEMFADDEDKKQKPPQVVLMGNGEIIPFTLTFLVDNKSLWLVKGNDVATFELKSLDKGEK